MRCRDIILKVDKSNLGSIGIGNAIQSEYSHTAIHTELNDVIEADYPKTKKTDFEKWKKKNSNREYYFSDWYDSHVNVYSYVGKWYETGRFINFVFYRVSMWLKLTKLSLWFINRDDSNKVVCSELNGLCRGLPNPHKLTPDDFVKFIKKV
jgi:hypothetical protein